MPGEDCVLEMEVDPQGILIVRISGEFNFDAWLAQRRQLFRGDLAELDLDGRANLVDLSSLVPPQEDWFATVNRVVQELRTMGQPTGPVAYVVGAAEANTLTVKFFESVAASSPGISGHSQDTGKPMIGCKCKCRTQRRPDARACYRAMRLVTEEIVSHVLPSSPYGRKTRLTWT